MSALSDENLGRQKIKAGENLGRRKLRALYKISLKGNKVKFQYLSIYTLTTCKHAAPCLFFFASMT